MQQGASENPIDILKWTTDFCTALQNLSPDIQLFTAQCDSFIDQILNSCVLDPPNEDLTPIFLEESIPGIINVVMNLKNQISNSENKQAFIFLITNFTVLFQWIFSSDYFQIFQSFLPVFDENSLIYANNNGGQKPSEMWRESMKKFIDLSLFEVLILRFQEEDVRIEHFQSCLQVFSFIMPALDIKPTIELGAQLFQYFQTFLNEINASNFDEKIDNTQALIYSLNKMSEIMAIIHDKSSFLKGFDTYMHLLQTFIEIDKDDKTNAALSLISFFVDFQSDEVNEKLKEFTLNNILCKNVKILPINILKLIINNISSSDLLEYLQSIEPITKSKDALILLQPKLMKKLIKAIPKTDTRIPPVLIDVACLAATSNPKLAKAIISKSFKRLNLSNINYDSFSPLYDQYRSQLIDICVSYIGGNKEYVNFQLILNIFSEIVKKKPSVLTDEIVNHIYSLLSKEEYSSLLPILEKAYTCKSKRNMNKEQVEMLLKSPNHKQVWNVFNNLIKLRGISPFDYDMTTSIFYDFKADDNNKVEKNENEKVENDCVTKSDLTDPSYIDFIFNYILCVNIKNKNIPPPPNAPPSLLQPEKCSYGPSQSSESNEPQSDKDSSEKVKSNSNAPTTIWITQQFDLVNWPLIHFDYLLSLVIINEIEMDAKNKGNDNSNAAIKNEHTIIYKKLFNVLKNIGASLIKPFIQTFIDILTEQNEDNSFYVTLYLFYQLITNIESCKCLKDYGIIQHFITDAPYEPDLPNEVTVTYDNKSQTVRYDPDLAISEILRSAALKFGSTNEGLVLRNKDNKMLSNQTRPNPDPEGYKMTGKLNPIKYDELPSYILSDDEVSFTSFLLTKLVDEHSLQFNKLIENFLEYLPTDPQIQDLVFNPDELIESLKSQNNCYVYFYMVKAALHRSRSRELISLYRKTDIFNVIKHDYLSGRFEYKNAYYLLSFIYYFFNDDQVDTEMILRLVEEARNIKTYNGNNKRTIEVLIKYADLSNEINITQNQNSLADYLIKNKFVEPLITTCNESLKMMMANFITSIIPLQYLYELFMQNPNNVKISNIFLPAFPLFLNGKNEKEKDQIVTNLIDKFVFLNDIVVNNSLIAIFNKDIITIDYINKMLYKAMLITKEPMRSNVINAVISFCKSKSNPQPQQQQNQQQQNQQQAYEPLNLDNEYERCIYNFLENIAKIKFVGNDLYLENPIRSNFEYVRQELLHLKPIRDCLLNPENQDFFVGNKSAHDLQLYFSQMILGNPIPQFMYVKSNTLSPYKLLVDLVNKVFSSEMRDQLFSFVPSQCIVDTSIFDHLENATPVVVVHLTHYTPSNIPIDIKVKNEMYNLTGIITKETSFNDPSIVNLMNAKRSDDDQPNGDVNPVQKSIYRTIILEGATWLIYQDQFINRIDEERLYPIFQAEFNTSNANSLKPYVLFYTKEKEINKFDINFNESPEIKYSMLHFQTKDQLPKSIVDEINNIQNKSVIEKFSISNTVATLFQNFADPKLLFTYFVCIYCRSNSTLFNIPYKTRILTVNNKKDLPSLDLVVSLLDTICESYKQITQFEFADTLTLIICAVINQNVVPDCDDEENKSNFEKIVKLIEKFAELFPELKFNFNTQNKISKIFHTFILSTNSFIKIDEPEKESEMLNSYDVCLSLNVPIVLLDSIFSNFSKNRSLNYINLMRANETLHCLSCFVEMLGESLRQILVHVSQIQASNVNNFELMMLLMKCVKYNVFTLDELKEVVLEANQFLSGLNIVNVLMNGLLTLSTDQEVAEIADVFYNDQILLYFLDRLRTNVENNNKQLIQKMISTSSVFFLNLFVYNRRDVQNTAFVIAAKMVDNETTLDISDFVVKLSDYFNSELSLLLINHIITTCICDHQLIAEHLIERAAKVDFIGKSGDDEKVNDDSYKIDDKNVSDSTDIFGATVYETEDVDEKNQEGYNYANAFFKVLENLTIKNFDEYMPFILTKLTTVDNLRFFIKHFNREILTLFEEKEDEIIPIISIYRHSLSENPAPKSNAANARLSKLKGYELVAEFINCVLGIDPQSSIIKKIIINRERGYVPYEFVQFIPAISTATNPDEVETFLPPKILVKSLNYSITKVNTIENEQSKNEDCLVAVQYFLQILLKHYKEFDLTHCFLNIPEISKFTLKFGNTKTSQDLIQLIKIISTENSMFKDLLEDEIDTQIRRNAIVPNLNVIKMELELNLDFENVKNNVKNVVEKIAKIHNLAIQSVITPSPSVDSLSTLNVNSSDYLFNYYLFKHFEETPVVYQIFGISLLDSKKEKQFFSSALSKLDDENFLKFCKDYIKNSKTLTQLTFDQLDMKRIWFLMKLKPNCAEGIKKMIPVDRRRVIMMLKLMPDGQKYALKVFDIKNEEIGLSSTQNQQGSEQQEQQKTSPGIHREASSAPNLAGSQNEARPPPPQNNNNNNSDKNKSSGSSKPYFFQRPTMPKRKPPPK